MNNFDGQEKSKNAAYNLEDYDSSKERGGCLSVFLGFAIIGNIFVILFLLTTFSSVGRQVGGGTSILLFGIFAVQVGVFMSVIGLWNWKRWGYNGMLAGYGIGIVVSFLGANLWQVIGSLIGIIILTQLMKDKMHYLE